MKQIYEGILIFGSILLLAFVISPLELVFVVSGSMSPTIQPNSDMFIIDKSVNSVDDYETGDVITFYSPDREQLTTHRVVDRTSEGLITQGDNAFQTDQERGDPPITDELITGKAVNFNGEVLTIANAAPIAIFFNEHTYKILFGLLLILIVDEFTPKSKDRSSRRSRDVTPFKLILMLSFGLVLVWTGAIYFSTIVESGQNIVVTEDEDTENRRFINPDEQIERRQVINIESYIPTHDAYEAVGPKMEITDVERLGSESEIEYVAGPYDSTGVQTPTFRIYTYPQTLPDGMINSLHNIHPLLASFATLSVIIIPINLFILLFMQNTRLRFSRSRLLRKIGLE